jgi:hypothetical protein
MLSRLNHCSHVPRGFRMTRDDYFYIGTPHYLYRFFAGKKLFLIFATTT